MRSSPPAPRTRPTAWWPSRRCAPTPAARSRRCIRARRSLSATVTARCSTPATPAPRSTAPPPGLPGHVAASGQDAVCLQLSRLGVRRVRPRHRDQRPRHAASRHAATGIERRCADDCRPLRRADRPSHLNTAATDRWLASPIHQPETHTMRTHKTLAILGALLTASAMAAGPTPDYKPVTAARLANPEPENWLLTKGNYAGWSYTPLEQITPANVKRLRPVWSAATGVNSGHEAPAIVNGEYMFVATPHNQVIAYHAKTGKMLWKFVREVPEGLGALHRTNRGVSLYGDKVYVGSIDCMISALDAKTGKLLWDA